MIIRVASFDQTNCGRRFPCLGRAGVSWLARVGLGLGVAWLGLVAAHAAETASTNVAPHAVDAPAAEAPASTPRRIGPDRFEIGRVTLDRAKQSLSFPAAVNQRAGLIEYMVVTVGGKIHESVFRTDAAPRDIHLGALLLGLQPANTNAFPEEATATLPGQPVEIDVTWQVRGREVRRRLDEFVRTTDPARPFRRGPWIYNGSFLADGAFVAQYGGSIVAIQTDPSALINNPRPDRTDDDIHVVEPKRLPQEGTRVTIVIRPARKAAPARSPDAAKAG